MADEQQQTSTPKSAGKSKDSGQSKRREFSYEEATERGYIGQVAEKPPDEAYRVDADHEATAQAQREALRERRSAEADASREGD